MAKAGDGVHGKNAITNMQAVIEKIKEYTIMVSES